MNELERFILGIMAGGLVGEIILLIGIKLKWWDKFFDWLSK